MFTLHRVFVVVLLALSLAVPAFSAETDDTGAFKPAIPPGQEKLLLEMLGNEAWLPEGCKLAHGTVNYTVVQVTYQCPWGNTVLEFAHVGEVESPDAQTEQFDIKVREGSAPVNLSDVVAEYIRDHEDDFEWTWPGLEDSEDADGGAGE